MEERPVAIIDMDTNAMSMANNIDDMFSFDNTDFIEDPLGPKDEIVLDQPIEDPIEDSSEEPIEETQEVIEEAVEDQEYSEYSKPALLALALREESDLFADLEVDKQTDASTLINKITSSYSQKIQEAKESIKSEYEQIADYIEMVKRGDVETLNSGIMLDNILAVNVEEDDNEESLKQIISYSNALKSISQEDTDNLIEAYLDKGIIKTKALESQQFLANYKSNLVNSKLEEYRIQEEEQLAQTEAIKKNVKSFLQNDPTIKAVVKDVDLIYKTMFEPTEVVKYKDDKGNSRVNKVPKIQLLMEEFQNNVQKQIIFTQLLLNNFSLDDVSSIKEKAKTKQIINLLEDKKSTPTNKWVDKLN